jgi:hypothetical protein
MMFNPFEKMSADLLQALRSKGKRWLVSQSLDLDPAEMHTMGKIPLLLTHYEEAGMAGVHLKARADDKFACLIDLDRDTHRCQLGRILQSDSKYLVYSCLIRSRQRAERIAAELYKEKYHKYILQYSKSGVSPNKSLRPSIQLIFGEIFIVLKYGSETLRTKLSEIEKM